MLSRHSNLSLKRDSPLVINYKESKVQKKEKHPCSHSLSTSHVLTPHGYFTLLVLSDIHHASSLQSD